MDEGPTKKNREKQGKNEKKRMYRRVLIGKITAK